MTSTNPPKRLMMIAGYISILIIILLLISRMMGYLNEGSIRSDILHLPEFEPQHHAIYTLTQDGNTGETISDETLYQLLEDYLMAWVSKNHAILHHQPDYLTDHFTPNSQEQYESLIDHQVSTQTREEIVTLNHEIDVKFQSLDQSVVVLNDHNVIEHRRIFQDETLILTQTDTSDYQVICLKEDGHWKIRHLTKKTKSTSTKANDKPLQYNVNNWKGYNYYPQRFPWDTFSEEMLESTYQADLELLKSIGTNSIRIFLQYEDFGGPSVTHDKVNRLIQLLDRAEESDIGVVVTLFDFYSDYRLHSWTQTDHHTRSIVDAIRNHPAFLAYDIKNEPDLDFEQRGKSLVLSWLSHQIALIKSLDTLHPITIGWSNAKSAVLLSDEVDIVSFHYYQPADEFGHTITTLRNKIGQDRPLLLSEFGMTSYRGAWNPIQYSEVTQATYLRSIADTCHNHSLGYLAWTLYDFAEVPDQVVGLLPWRKAYQRHYGLIKTNGKPKPAFIELTD